MATFRNHIALLAMCASAPVAATDWDSVAGWDIYEIDRSRCVVGRMFPEAGGAIVGIILNVDGEARLFANSSNWRARPGQGIDAAVGLDGQTAIANGFVGVEEKSRRGFVAAASPQFLAAFAGAKQLTVRADRGAATEKLTLTGSAAGLAQGRQCVASLREEAKDSPAPSRAVVAALRPTVARAFVTRPAAAPRLAARPATPSKSKASWVAADDYPDAALRAEEQGSVTVKLAIDSSGAVGDCDIVKSSGSRTLDGTTCRVIQRRARYRPALDSSGRPVVSFDQHTVRWTLPEG